MSSLGRGADRLRVRWRRVDVPGGSLVVVVGVGGGVGGGEFGSGDEWRREWRLVVAAAVADGAVGWRSQVRARDLARVRVDGWHLAVGVVAGVVVVVAEERLTRLGGERPRHVGLLGRWRAAQQLVRPLPILDDDGRGRHAR